MQAKINKVPPASLVLPHYAFAAIAFLVLTILMFFSSDSFVGHYFNPKLLAVTHIATLGWGSMIIFGTLYQLVPVILNTELYSITLGKLTFVSFVLGITLLVNAFWTFSVGILIQMAAVFLLMGASLFFINIILTARKVKRFTIEAEFIVSSTIWFWLTVLVGTLLAFNFSYVFLPKDQLHYLKLHAHIGIAGWFVLLIMGVSSKLIPMFLLSTVTDNKKLKYAFNLINVSIIGFMIDSLFLNGNGRGIIYFLIAISGLMFYLAFLIETYKKRARKVLDIGMKHSFYAVIIITIPAIFGFLANTDLVSNSADSLQVTIMFGVSIFLGFISTLILGLTFKTLPFIVWLDKYQQLSGRKKVPLPKDLYSEILVKYQLICFVCGLFTLFCGIIFSEILIIKFACVLLIITALLYNINVFKMLLHKPKNVLYYN